MSNGAPATAQFPADAVSGAAFLMLDEEGRIQSANSVAADLLGYPRDALRGLPLHAIFDDASQALTQASRNGSMIVASPFRRQDGSETPLEGILSRVEPGGYALMASTGEERLKLQRRLAQNTADLHEMLYRISHDLKAPLRSVKSFCELLQRRFNESFDQDAREYMEFIVDGAKEMEQILTDLLAYSQAGRPDRTRPQRTDTAGMLQFALMNVDGLAKKAGARITWDALPEVIVDQTQLASVFQHLLTNAIRFRKPDVAPEIHVSAVEDARTGMVQISVADNGPGIDPELHEQVFAIFRRLVGREIPGTGIGLPICRKIVEAAGGRMWLESEPDRGTTLRFTLPLA